MRIAFPHCPLECSTRWHPLESSLWATTLGPATFTPTSATYSPGLRTPLPTSWAAPATPSLSAEGLAQAGQEGGTLPPTTSLRLQQAPRTWPPCHLTEVSPGGGTCPFLLSSAPHMLPNWLGTRRTSPSRPHPSPSPPCHPEARAHTWLLITSQQSACPTLILISSPAHRKPQPLTPSTPQTHPLFLKCRRRPHTVLSQQRAHLHRQRRRPLFAPGAWGGRISPLLAASAAAARLWQPAPTSLSYTTWGFCRSFCSNSSERQMKQHKQVQHIQSLLVAKSPFTAQVLLILILSVVWCCFYDDEKKQKDVFW